MWFSSFVGRRDDERRKIAWCEHTKDDRRSLILPMRQLLERFKIESVLLSSHGVSGSNTSVTSTDRSQTNHSKAFTWRIADTNSWPIFSENGESRCWGRVERRKWKWINRHVAGKACPVWCDGLWRCYYRTPKIKTVCQNQFVVGLRGGGVLVEKLC